MSLKIRSDKKYMEEHMGLYSDRRRASGKYSNDARGRFTYRGVPVNDGGYVRGRLRDESKERREFGPGEPWAAEREGDPSDEEKEPTDKRTTKKRDGGWV